MNKLLQINTVVNSTSIGRIAEEIGVISMHNGWESHIAYGRMTRQSRSQLIKIGTNWDVKWHGIHTRLFDRHGFGSKNATYKLVKRIENIKPSIIHLHNLHGYYLNIKTLFNYLKNTNIPLVWTLHDCWSFTGHCTHFDFKDCNKWKTECFNCPQRKEYPASLFWDNSRSNFHFKKQLFTSVPNITLIPVSYWLEGLVKQSFLSDCSRKVIHNGIDTKLFSPKETTKIREKYNLEKFFVVLGVANVWSSRKGLIDFIELGKKLDSRVKIILVGLNNKQIKSLPRKIIGIPRTESIEKLAELYSLADLFINPTWEDNFPTTNLEAMSCGTPVLTYRTGGSIESINDNTGFIVEKGDIAGMLLVIEKVMATELRGFSANCRENILKNFDKNQRYLDYLQLYNELLKYN